MLDMIDSLLSIGQKLFGFRETLATAKKQRKADVSDFLSTIATCIEETSALLAQGQYPGGKCQELLFHSQHMEQAIGDLIGSRQAQDLGAQLAEVHQIEMLHAKLGQLPADERVRRLSVLDQSAGLIRATAAFVKVSP